MLLTMDCLVIDYMRLENNSTYHTGQEELPGPSAMDFVRRQAFQVFNNSDEIMQHD